MHPLYDAHTHLNADQLYPDRHTHLQQFIAVGGKGLINIGVNHDYNIKALDIAHQRKNNPHHDSCVVGTTIGIHPCEIADQTITADTRAHERKNLTDLYHDHHDFIVGIGECGIDTYTAGTEHTVGLQQQVFAQQCQRARELGLPVIIHSRANFDATWSVVQQFPDVTMYRHCRSYTPTEVRLVLSHPTMSYVGFCGNITYPKALDIRASLDTLRQLSPQSLLMETDAPYLAPQSHRGQLNTPALISHTYEYVIQHLGIAPIPFHQQIQDNFMKLYGLAKQ